MSNPSLRPSTANGNITSNSHADASGDFPYPPPGANKLQLELWRRVVSHRCLQIQALSQVNFQIYVDVIALDLKTSRFTKVRGGGNEQAQIDLAKGNYSSNLISQGPPLSSITARDVACHIISLFYRTVDERLSSDERTYALDTVKRAFSLLDNALKDQALHSNNAQKTANNDQEMRNTSIIIDLQSQSSSDSSTQMNDTLTKNSAPQTSRDCDKRLHEKDGSEDPKNKRSREEVPHSINEQGKETAHEIMNHDKEGGENELKSKRQRTTQNVRDKPNERESDAVEKYRDQGNDSDRIEQDSTKLTRKDHTAETQSQHPSNSQGKQKEGGEAEPKKKLHQRDPGLTSNADGPKENHHLVVEDDPAIVVVDLVTADSTFANSKNTAGTSDRPPSSQKYHTENLMSSSNKNQNDAPKERSNATTGSLSGNGKDSDTYGKSSSSQTSSSQKEMSLSNKKHQNTGGKATGSSASHHPPIALPSIALPPPTPTYCMLNVTFVPDNHSPSLVSASLNPRPACTLRMDAGFHFDGSGAALDNKAFLDVRSRLERWDPYWKVVKEFGHKEVPAAGQRKMTKVSTRTTSCVSVANQLSNNNIQNLPTSCAMVTVDLPSECINAKQSNTNSLGNETPWGLKLGQPVTEYTTGDRRLLLRMLPLKRTDKDKKRSDTHQWPIGTFLQLSRGAEEHVLLIAQRRQQNHDPKLWKGPCYPLDMTRILPDARSPFSIKICTREVIEKVTYNNGTKVRKLFEDEELGKMRPFSGLVKGYDDGYYRIVYEDGDGEDLTHEEVSNILVKKNDSSDEEGKFLQGSYAIHLAVAEYIAPDDMFEELIGNIQKISLEPSKNLAKQYLARQTVSLDSDSDEGSSSNGSTLTFSLICPVSKLAIGTAVRGQHCRHMQCFDLKSFLHSNKHVSGGRWRCGVCEDFLSVRDLVQCGLFEAMLHDHRDKISGARDKVSFRPDGTWSLKEENKLRYSGSNAVGGDATELVSQPEVIDLL